MSRRRCANCSCPTDANWLVGPPRVTSTDSHGDRERTCPGERNPHRLAKTHPLVITLPFLLPLASRSENGHGYCVNRQPGERADHRAVDPDVLQIPADLNF